MPKFRIPSGAEAWAFLKTLGRRETPTRCGVCGHTFDTPSEAAMCEAKVVHHPLMGKEVTFRQETTRFSDHRGKGVVVGVWVTPKDHDVQGLLVNEYEERTTEERESGSPRKTSGVILQIALSKICNAPQPSAKPQKPTTE